MIQLKVYTLEAFILQVSVLTYPQTMMNCIDNSGAAIVECVKVMKMKRHAKIGPPSLLDSIYPIY